MPLTTLPPEQEKEFRNWYADWVSITGVSPNPDDPRHFYDWRGAYLAGARPVLDPSDSKYHWPSAFKQEGHPNLYIGGIDTRTGQPVQPQQPAGLGGLLQQFLGGRGGAAK